LRKGFHPRPPPTLSCALQPAQQQEKQHLEKAVRIILDQRPGSTPVGIATAVGRGEEKIILTDLNHLLDYEINMQSTVIIGNRSSKELGGWFITPRGYRR
jgi:precorrin-3B methylase